MTGIRTTGQKPSRKRAGEAREPQGASSGKHEVDKYGFAHEKGAAGVTGGGLNNSHSSLYSPRPAVSNPSMPHLLPDWKAPWQPLRSRGRRVRLLLSANEVGTWGSASLRLPFSTIHRTIDAEGRIICECLTSDTIFSYLNPRMDCVVAG